MYTLVFKVDNWEFFVDVYCLKAARFVCDILIVLIIFSKDSYNLIIDISRCNCQP